MEVINKRHSDIEFKKKLDNVPYINFYNENEIHFSARAVEKLKILIGTYAHFINDNENWFFYVNNDKDGFSIQASNRRYATCICNGSLVRLFLKRTGREVPVKYPLTITKMEHETNPIFKIELNKPFE